ncbi:hypothetical protein BC938DRAFT_483631 [Jimgerdemannia flammicorona]|uniref:Uncharacterized protein n=1 Tax=Jimgerdemannia flammicorona TaxID=994334 RepID=A0A433QVK2_9FUNG|nr:hypothetical protein BC938DRAFT_483631 [Jimgerdemannia flammicorona]
MLRQIFVHREAVNAVLPKKFGQLLVADHPPPVLRILQVVLLNVCPHPFDDFGTRELDAEEELIATLRFSRVHII